MTTTHATPHFAPAKSADSTLPQNETVFPSASIPPLGKVNALKPGRTVLFNLAWAMLYGPGRLTEI